MRIAYITTDDPWDLEAWSGLVTHILMALQGSGLDVQAVGNLDDHDLAAFVKGFIYGRILSKTYFRESEPSLLKHYANQVEGMLKSIPVEVVFSARTIPIAYLRTDKPIVFWHDTTVAGLAGFYPGYENSCAESIRNGIRVDQLALTKCRLAIYSSDWAAATAIQNYSVDPAKVKVVPFGANISTNRTVQDIKELIQKKNFDTCKLLFIGLEWFRKGGDTAVKVAEQLNRRGIRTELHIVGCNPPTTLPDFVKSHGFVSKASEGGQKYLDDLFTQSHFFIMPSRAEAFGIVFAEASSFGLPSLGTKVGGIPSAIVDGKNGQTFALDESPKAYCDYIGRLFSSRQEYEHLALTSFQEYSERLNWTSAGRKVADLIREFC